MRNRHQTISPVYVIARVTTLQIQLFTLFHAAPYVRIVGRTSVSVPKRSTRKPVECLIDEREPKP